MVYIIVGIVPNMWSTVITDTFIIFYQLLFLGRCKLFH